MSNSPTVDLKHNIEEAIGWLRRAVSDAVEDPDVCDGWKAWGVTVDHVQAVLTDAEKLLPLHPELEAACEEEWDYICSHDSADGT